LGAETMADSLLPNEYTNDKFVKLDQSITVEYIPRHIKMIPLTENDVDALASGGTDFNLGFLGICVGAFIAFALVLNIGGVVNPIQHGTHVGLTFASGLLSVYFGVNTAKSRARHRRVVNALKSGKLIG
jgi:hypothetical protein